MSRQPLDFSLNLGIDNSRRNSVFDVWIVTSVFLLSLLGISMIYSASQSVEMALRQGIYMVFGFVVLTIISFSNFRKMEVFYLYSYWPGLFLLIIVLFFSNENNETSRWIDLGMFTIQPSELMRFLLPLSAAAFLSRKPSISNFDYLVVFVLTLLATFLVLLQPDLGTALIVLLSGILPILLGGLPWRYIYLGAFVTVCSLPLIWFSLYEYQQQRILTLFNPEADIYGAGWNIAQSKIAIGSGGFWGKGYLNGSQSQLNFIPESHSDFIFSVISEEFGLIGVLFLMFLYGLLIYRLIFISIKHQNRFAKILSATLSTILLAYISINICMVIGLLPVVGMPLPFVSQGGTALIINLVTIGIILSLRRET